MIKIRDYATGKMINSTPEEVYRQEFEHILIDDLGILNQILILKLCYRLRKRLALKPDESLENYIKGLGSDSEA